MNDEIVEVKWLDRDKYIPKLGTYQTGKVRSMPKGLAEIFQNAKSCKILTKAEAKVNTPATDDNVGGTK